MAHDQRDTLKDYWSRDEQYYTAFYNNTMVQDRFLHILKLIKLLQIEMTQIMIGFGRLERFLTV
jgi:hypothetical protein